uniref:peptidylprolyl isomerase n=1 Tax=Theileria parva TaxID=5875 RepID=Q4N020_THEPA|eukprot:XP_763352.1 hypothetical protein [Theileria parva strain Muguga]
MENQGEISPSEKEALAKEFRDLEEIRTREAKSRAVVLEILGDIPDADITPPKNVLFVCKLNPVTEEKDLKIIFSRFGNVKSCDIIKDYVTGDSLQYAFIEFETEESCNEAYFKMQNVLIDDRRLSVSGFWKRFYNRETFTRNKRHNSDKNYPKDRKNYHKSYQNNEKSYQNNEKSYRNNEKSYRKSYKRYGNHYNRDRSPEHRHSRRRSRSRSRERHRKRSRSRDRHRTERHRTRSRSRDRHRSRRHS